MVETFIFQMFRELSYIVCHCEEAMGRRGNPFPPWLPLWGSCHEVTERVKIALSALTGHLSHRERQGPHPSRLRRATFTLWSNCHWQLLNFDSLRGAPPRRGRLWKRIVTGGNPWKGPHQCEHWFAMTPLYASAYYKNTPCASFGAQGVFWDSRRSDKTPETGGFSFKKPDARRRTRSRCRSPDRRKRRACRNGS